MTRTIFVDADEPIACPKCGHGFALSEGLSRQAIERHAEAFERSLAERSRALEAQLAAEARAQFELERKAAAEALAAKESSLQKFRSEELQLRRRLRELEEAKRNVDADYQRRLDEELKRREALFQARIASARPSRSMRSCPCPRA